MAATYTEFFNKVTGHPPYPYQGRLGTEDWPHLLDIPTGLGKTAAVVIAWLWKRLQQDSETPRRLVYCLPMRVLVEQTVSNTRKWLEASERVFEESGRTAPGVFVLMGGEAEDEWARNPEEHAVIVGTQDMLLSRALMRGYGMSRYTWPVHFSLLHNDALWVLDEVQLMGPGVATSAQLEAFRRSFPLAKSSRSLWVSATLNRDWLDTVDLREHLDGANRLGLSEEDRQMASVAKRSRAAKRLSRAQTEAGPKANTRRGQQKYARDLAAEIYDHHRVGRTTLVVLNTVARAQAVFHVLTEQVEGNSGAELLLVHSRFRPPDRRSIEEGMTKEPGPEGRIVVATQAVEAGVDMTSAVLFTELAPWSSMVQRFGRCNRYGEVESAEVRWIDIDTEEKPDLAAPYDAEPLDRARQKLEGLDSASPGNLAPTDEEAPPGQILRRKDLLELFNTDPDLSGFDIDVSPYIRDTEETDLQVFWRNPAEGFEDQPGPERDELCRASLSEFLDYYKRIQKKDEDVFVWDALSERWRRFREQARPGLTLMLNARLGGYDPRRGFLPGGKAAVEVLPPEEGEEPEAYGADSESVGRAFVELARHLLQTEEEVDALCAALDEDSYRAPVRRAARWHDVGKSHPVFQQTLTRCDAADERQDTLWAKSPCKGRHARRHFRHELASMLGWIAQHGDEHEADLVAYLVAAHHGKVRMGLRALPTEQEPEEPGRRFARGVWEGDELPGFSIGDREEVAPARLRLDVMELGRGPQGPSWTARTQALLAEHGPFRLAWLESLVRIADWRCSARAEKSTEGDR